MPRTRVRELPRTRKGLKVRRVLDWEAAGWAGLLAGFCALLLEIALMPLAVPGATFWAAPRMMAYILFDGAMPTDSGPAFLLSTAVLAHLTLGLVYGRIVAGLIYSRPAREAAWIGAAFGLALYFVNFYGLGALVPRLYACRDWAWLAGHVAFGLIAARAFLRLERVVYE